MKMPFGKFQGRPCHEVPRYYLRWALATLDLSGDLKTAMKKGLEKIEWNPPPPRDLDKLVDETCCEWGGCGTHNARNSVPETVKKGCGTIYRGGLGTSMVA